LVKTFALLLAQPLQREVEVTKSALKQHRDIFQQKVITMQQQMMNLHTSFIRQNQTLERLTLMHEQLTNSIATINTRQEQISGMIEELRNNNNNNFNNNAMIGNNVVQNENNNTINLNVVIPPVVMNATNNTTLEAGVTETNDNNLPSPETIIQNQRNRRPRINGLNAINGTPRVPPMAILFPESWMAILEEWNLHNLSSFVGYGRRAHFTVKENSRFSKRCRAINQLKRLAMGRGDSLRDIAEQLDGERTFRIQQAIASQ
jgi:hypothetical protein